MNSDQPLIAAAHRADAQTRAPGAERTVLPGGPPRPLGAKTAALHARRQQAAIDEAARRPARRRATDCVQLAGVRGTVTFLLRRTHSVLYVERGQRRPPSPSLTMAMVFHTADDFERWCDADPVRFDDPLLFCHLRQHGHELLQQPG
jgi:hypothetical protein